VTVLDASAVLDVLLGTGEHVSVQRIMTADARGLVAPHLLDAEVGQVLRRYTLAGVMTTVRAEEALEDLAALRIRRYPHGPLLRRAFALHANATIYDALYLALAEGLGATLVTRDRALGTIPGHRARVRVLR
jgi:predicted nucleic acid-binding protein